MKPIDDAARARAALTRLRAREQESRPICDGYSSRESYLCSKARPWLGRFPITDDEVVARILDHQPVVVTERREVVETEGAVAFWEAADSTVQTLTGLESFARINGGGASARTAEEARAREYDRLNLSPVEPGSSQFLLFRRVREFERETHPCSDMSLALTKDAYNFHNRKLTCVIDPVTHQVVTLHSEPEREADD